MTADIALPLLMRWIHVGTAIVVVGGLVYYRFVFVPIAEGFGLPPLEAMRCGAPVVTSNCSSLPEVVGDAAVLVDPTNAGELVATLRRLLADESGRSELRRRGFDRAELFSWRKTAELTREVYRFAIENRVA